MLKCRTSGRSISTAVGLPRKKNGRTIGHRVHVLTPGVKLSVYPEDARKFALELLRVADECDKP